MDQIVDQAAKIHYMFSSQVSLSDRSSGAWVGSSGATSRHSIRRVTLLKCSSNVAGLKMFLPSTPYDMKEPAEDRDPQQQPSDSPSKSSQLLSDASRRIAGERDYAIPVRPRPRSSAEAKDVHRRRALPGWFRRRWPPRRNSPRKASRSRSSTHGTLDTNGHRR